MNLGYRVYSQVREEQQVASAEQSTEKQLVGLLYNGDLEMEWGSDAAQVWENGLKTPLELLDVSRSGSIFKALIDIWLGHS